MLRYVRAALGLTRMVEVNYSSENTENKYVDICLGKRKKQL